MMDKDRIVGIIGIIVFVCAWCITSWLLNVYFIVKTEKWMGWL